MRGKRQRAAPRSCTAHAFGRERGAENEGSPIIKKEGDSLKGGDAGVQWGVPSAESGFGGLAESGRESRFLKAKTRRAQQRARELTLAGGDRSSGVGRRGARARAQLGTVPEVSGSSVSRAPVLGQGRLLLLRNDERLRRANDERRRPEGNVLRLARSLFLPRTRTETS